MVISLNLIALGTFKIIETTTLSAAQKSAVIQLWNDEYPTQLGFSDPQGFEHFIQPLQDPKHVLMLNGDNEIIGWAYAFIREQERWFAIIVHSEYQRKQVGSQLLSRLKSLFENLNGWVIDHENYSRKNGQLYPSPLNFYLKNGFRTIPWIRLEIPVLSAVKIALRFPANPWIIETDRFKLREMTMDDAENAYLLNQDSEVVKYTGDVSFESIEAARKFLSEYKQFERNGFGRWAVIRKSDEKYMGWCGLRYTKQSNEVDIGFRFRREFWGNGMATETAIACLQFAKDQLTLKRVVAHVLPANIASVKVLQKIGLQQNATAPMFDETWMNFEITWD